MRQGLFIPDITVEMFRNGCLESIELLMAEGEIYDIDYSRWIPVYESLPTYTGLYLVSIDDLVTTMSFDGAGFRNHGSVRVEVDAWMSLPEPYKKDGEEE